MPKTSAGLLVYREREGHLEILLVHPGGPFWAKKDIGAWSIPKGEIEDNDELLDVAKREFKEETGFEIGGIYLPLDPLRQPSGKTVYAWAIKGDFDPQNVKSNTFTMEWPPKSRQVQEYPEVDRAEWYRIDIAIEKILPGQRGFILQLLEKLGR